MPKITQIQAQDKNKNRRNVFVDGSYEFSCDIEIIVKYKLKEGLEIDRTKLLEVIDQSKEEFAFRLALNYLSFKSRTSFEISAYLLKKEYEEKIVEKVIGKLKYYQYVDDNQYVLNYIKAAITEGKKGKDRVQSDLINKKISQDIIEYHMHLFSYETNLQIAKELSNKYFKQNAHLPFNQIKNKLSQFLMRKGFNWEIINTCLNTLEQDAEVQSHIDSNRELYLKEAIKLGSKYFSKYKTKETNPYLLERKVKVHLYQKGYDKDIINLAFADIIENS